MSLGYKFSAINSQTRLTLSGSFFCQSISAIDQWWIKAGASGAVAPGPTLKRAPNIDLRGPFWSEKNTIQQGS